MILENTNQLLSYEFFNRPTLEVARDLLGKLLVKQIGEQVLIGKIVETEAYLGSHDPAAHAAAGRTKRTEILFGEPGRAYIFQLRGHHCMNVTAEETGNPACVLIRALEPLLGKEYMWQLRGSKITKETNLTNGPGKLCQAFEINMSHYGVDLTALNSPLYIAERDSDHFEIEVTARIGITKAADKLFRFIVKNSYFVSK